MPRFAFIRAAGAAAAVLGFVSLAALDQPPAQPHSGSNCFLVSDWQGWKSPSPKVIYVRVSTDEYFRLDLESGSSELQDPGMHLINKTRGSPWVCSPLDLDLSVADGMGGFREPLIVKSITRLTPAEVKEIPPKFRP